MAKTSKVARMSDYSNNCLSISPEQAISDLQEFLKDHPAFDKVFLIAVNTKEGDFLHSWHKGQMLCSEAIAALHLCLDDQTQALKKG